MHAGYAVSLVNSVSLATSGSLLLVTRSSKPLNAPFRTNEAFDDKTERQTTIQPMRPNTGSKLTRRKHATVNFCLLLANNVHAIACVTWARSSAMMA